MSSTLVAKKVTLFRLDQRELVTLVVVQSKHHLYPIDNITQERKD